MIQGKNKSQSQTVKRTIKHNKKYKGKTVTKIWNKNPKSKKSKKLKAYS